MWIAVPQAAGGGNRIPARYRLPQEWTLTQPGNRRPLSQFGGRLVAERTATLRWTRACNQPAADLVDRAADRDNFRDSEDQIGSLVT
jgi:hypothetical protein